MRDFDPVAFGNRLEERLEEAGLDIKQFQEELAKRTQKARGTSYGSVWSYVNGKAPLDPRREVVEAMGEVLDCSTDFLLYGIEPRTEARKETGEHAEAVARADERQRYEAWRLKLEVLHAMGVVPRFIELPTVPGKLEEADDFHAWATRVNVRYIPHWVPALAEVRARYGRKSIATVDIGQALRGPLEAVGIDPASGADATYRTREWLDDYIAGMVPVLLALGPERQRQREASKSEEDNDG